MLGVEHKQQTDDNLPVSVHALNDPQAFVQAQRLWSENARLLHQDKTSGKEYLRFSYAQPPVTAWLQRDVGRQDIFELILLWKETQATEVFVLSNNPSSASAGNLASQRLATILNAMLVAPSVVPTNQQK